VVTWIAAFLIAEVIPFFSSRRIALYPLSWVLLIGAVLSLMSSLFDCFFGFIFWGIAYFRMREADRLKGIKPRSRFGDAFQVALNGFIILIGLFFLTAGTYVSVQSIIDEFAAGAVKGVFSCASNGI
jgi:hypothetical protein